MLTHLKFKSDKDLQSFQVKYIWVLPLISILITAEKSDYHFVIWETSLSNEWKESKHLCALNCGEELWTAIKSYEEWKVWRCCYNEKRTESLILWEHNRKYQLWSTREKLMAESGAYCLKIINIRELDLRHHCITTPLHQCITTSLNTSYSEVTHIQN